jgi:hypothetical protein
MSKTVLEIVKDVLTAIDGDAVNSISDTEESEQIANFVQSAYMDLVSHTNWPHTRRATALTPFSDSNFPTHMKLNDNVKELISILYDKRKVGETARKYKEIKYLNPDDFLRKLNMRDNDKANVQIVVDPSGIELLIFNDKAPEYFTSINDVDVVFDSYDAVVDSTLQESKVQAQAYVMPPFSLVDDFIPDLPPDAFSLLVSEVISRSQLRLRQIQDTKAEQEANRQSKWMSRKSWRTAGGILYPNYGRKR